MQLPDFWNDQEHARKISEEYASLKNQIDFFDGIEAEINSLMEFSYAYEKQENRDEPKDTAPGSPISEEKQYVQEQYASLHKRYEETRIAAMLSGKYDGHGAILSVHAGAGGSDAQDWAEMLLRMFIRYAESKKLKVEVLETSKGSEAGIKSAIIEVLGFNAYGMLKSEAGVHRLVRLSPFNPTHTRETSFALVEVLPIIEHGEFEIDPKDIKMEVSTASGHGGQSVNTTYSAVRLTHIPTGIKVSIQNERSQSQNKEKALEILYSRLLVLEEEKRASERKELRGEFHSPEWGSQIRSYVLHPYKLVKDHRSAYESTDPESVLNGELDEFVEKYLETMIGK